MEESKGGRSKDGRADGSRKTALVLCKRVSGRSPFFHKPVLFKTDVCRCEFVGDRPGARSVRNTSFQFVSTTMLSRRVYGRSFFVHRPVLFKANVCRCELVVIGPGPNQSETNSFNSFQQGCFPKGFLAGAIFSQTGSGQNPCVSM